MSLNVNLNIPMLPARVPVLAIVTAAMEDEAAPLWDIAKGGGNIVRLGAKGSLQLLAVEDATIALVTTGIGLVNAASSLTAALQYVSPRYIFSCGSAGGLDAEAQVGEVVAASDCVYGRADAREFGYKLGQIPGMPESFLADGDLLDRFTSLPEKVGPACTRSGRFLSSDCFVGTELALEFRKSFPTATTVDMESAALAQVAAGVEVPFLAVRGISDLCGPEAAAENYQRAGDVARLSFLVALTLIGLREPEEIQ
ncbi:MAG: 5'-methylthioadenosine/S-adenosylhomocysteine nucleosidase [Mobiluncus sp.]|uniref:5'-methylthioadenosine/S-adenosylhomocysteine nucleosidase n=1 Tax=Mobiluncus sp. TaxID=47293 RepID=UPI002582BBE9|nr:5'-methylthioadenosine/S-adenosylhomocysteine nucleosidase [Mobiluncus sp.]MCI6584216.1 5'-methylthioadenosine/S-adenosylhomocysteine nucleosidase [Mobiluncus sp.]